MDSRVAATGVLIKDCRELESHVQLDMAIPERSSPDLGLCVNQTLFLFAVMIMTRASFIDNLELTWLTVTESFGWIE